MSIFRLVLVAFFLTGCSVPQILPSTQSLSGSDGKIVVIGKLELDPPLNETLEQKTHWVNWGDDRIVNKVFVATNSEANPALSEHMYSSDWYATIEASWGIPFMIEAPRQPMTWFNGAVTYLDAKLQDRLWFPGGLFFDVPENTNVIYIGTLRYKRDDFNNIVQVEVIDEYRETMEYLGLNGSENHNVAISLLKSIR